MATDNIEMVILKNYIDHNKHVNHLHYQNWFEDAQRSFLIKRGASFKDIQDIYGIRFVQRMFSVEFIYPLFLNDKINIETSVFLIGSTSFTFTQHILKDKQIVTTAQTVYVAIDAINNKIKLPDGVRNSFTLVIE